MSRLHSPVRGTGTSPSLPLLVTNLSAPLHSSPRDSSQAWQVLWFPSSRSSPPIASFRGLETRKLTRVCGLPWRTLLQPTQPPEPGFLASTLLSISAPRQPAHCSCCLKKRPHLLRSHQSSLVLQFPCHHPFFSSALLWLQLWLKKDQVSASPLSQLVSFPYMGYPQCSCLSSHHATGKPDIQSHPAG